jgi:CRP/FNR family cyclic AMP-dependent transcriptional regulator
MLVCTVYVMSFFEKYPLSLHQVPLFSACSRKELSMITNISQRTTLPQGFVLISEGSPAEDVYVVLKGSLKVVKGDSAISYLREGAVVGELALLDQGPRTASVVCESECVVLRFSRGDFYKIMKKIPDLSHRLMSILATRFREMTSSPNESKISQNTPV